MNRRFPVCPYPPAPRLLPAIDQEPIEKQQVINPIASSESIAESITKEFKYDPDDKTPPKRRMKAAAEAVNTMIDGDSGQSSATPCHSMPVAHVAIPASRLDLDHEKAQRKLEQARAQAGLEKIETSSPEGTSAVPSTLCALDVAARLADMEVILIANKATLETASDSVDVVHCRTTLTRRNLLRTDEAVLGDESLDEEDGPAAYFVKSDA